jgi:hypothetical protein
LDSTIVVYPDQNLLTMDTGTGPVRMSLQQFSETMITANDALSLISINRLSGRVHYTFKNPVLMDALPQFGGGPTEYYGQCRAVSRPAF